MGFFLFSFYPKKIFFIFSIEKINIVFSFLFLSFLSLIFLGIRAVSVSRSAASASADHPVTQQQSSSATAAGPVKPRQLLSAGLPPAPSRSMIAFEVSWEVFFFFKPFLVAQIHTSLHWLPKSTSPWLHNMVSQTSWDKKRVKIPKFPFGKIQW